MCCGFSPAGPSSNHQVPALPMPIPCSKPSITVCRVKAQSFQLVPSLASTAHSYSIHARYTNNSASQASPFPSFHSQPPFTVPTASGACLPTCPTLQSSLTCDLRHWPHTAFPAGTQPPGLCSRPPGLRPPAPARSPHPGANRGHFSCYFCCHNITLSPISTL